MNGVKEVDLHGYHPYDADLLKVIEGALRQAFDEGASALMHSDDAVFERSVLCCGHGTDGLSAGFG
jgi:hypothetical protein